MNEMTIPALVPSATEGNLTNLVAERAWFEPERIMLSRPLGEGWQPVTASEFETEVRTAAKGLIIWCTDCGPSGQMQVYSLVATNSVWTNMIGTTTYTRAERNALSPSINLQIYCSDCGTGESQLWNGSIWTNLAGGTAQ